MEPSFSACKTRTDWNLLATIATEYSTCWELQISMNQLAKSRQTWGVSSCVMSSEAETMKYVCDAETLRFAQQKKRTARPGPKKCTIKPEAAASLDPVGAEQDCGDISIPEVGSLYFSYLITRVAWVWVGVSYIVYLLWERDDILTPALRYMAKLDKYSILKTQFGMCRLMAKRMFSMRGAGILKSSMPCAPCVIYPADLRLSCQFFVQRDLGIWAYVLTRIGRHCDMSDSCKQSWTARVRRLPCS